MSLLPSSTSHRCACEGRRAREAASGEGRAWGVWGEQSLGKKTGSRGPNLAREDPHAHQGHQKDWRCDKFTLQPGQRDGLSQDEAHRALHSWCFCGQWPRSGILSLVLGQKKDGKHRCPPRSDIQPQDPLPPNNMTYHVGQVFGVIWYPVSTLSFTHLIGRGGKEEAKGLNRKGETMTSCRVGVWVWTSGWQEVTSSASSPPRCALPPHRCGTALKMPENIHSKPPSSDSKIQRKRSLPQEGRKEGREVGKEGERKEKLINSDLEWKSNVQNRGYLEGMRL